VASAEEGAGYDGIGQPASTSYRSFLSICYWMSEYKSSRDRGPGWKTSRQQYRDVQVGGAGVIAGKFAVDRFGGFSFTYDHNLPDTRGEFRRRT
jgi:hypothetical protein